MRNTLAARVSPALITLMLAFASLPAQADDQFWVSVASYTDQQDAEREASRLSAELAMAMRAVGAATAKGYFYRVAAGPFSSRDSANRQLRAAQAAGFSSAWLWVQDDVDALDTGFSDYGSELEPLDEAAIDALLSDDYEYTPEPLPDAAPDENAPRMREEPRSLIEEAPPGYKLNRLKRDAGVWRPPAHEPILLAQATAPPASSIEPSVLPPSPQSPIPDLPLQSDPGSPPTQLLLDIDPDNPITLARYDEASLDVTIDGRLDEAVWRNLPGVDSFRVVDPDTGAGPRHQTIVRMFYTERGLYASFEMEQPSSTLVTWYSGRDDGRLNRDNVGVTIDTSGEGRYGYWVNLALGGNQVDGTVLPERQFSRDWDGAWYGETAVTEKGWNAEILLPWSQVAMPKEAGQRTLNAYVSRKVAYLDERWAVPALPFTQPRFMSALQPLVLDDVNPQQQWSLFPYASVTQDEVEDFTQSKVGTDFFWRPSTNFQMTATLNPDFGNVESDDVIVNLSAFENFFPEKRLFFLEGTEVFVATPRADDDGDPTTVLNTRRIGGAPRAPDVPDDVEVPDRELGQPTELLGALKTVGQIGPMRYGLLAAAEDEVKFDVGSTNYHQDGSDYGVARFLYENKARSGAYRALGTISTLATHPEQAAQVHGLDYHYFSAGGDVKVDGQFLRSDIDDEGTGAGGFVDVVYNPRQGLRYELGLSHYDDGLDINDLGFLRRNDASRVRLDVNYTASGLDWARKLSVSSFGDYEMNGDGYRTRKGVGTRIGVDLNNRDSVRMFFGWFPGRHEDRDSRDNGVFLIEERHGSSFEYRTDSSKRFSYRVGFNHDGESLAGNRVQGQLGVVWRPVDQINIGATAQYRERDGWLLWQGDRDFATFTTREWRPRVNFDYFITAKQQLRFAAQWVGIKAEERDFYVVPDRTGDLVQVADPNPEPDDFSISRVNLQLRYRWELAPLSELFVVYTLNGEDDTAGAGFNELLTNAYDDPVGEQLVVKLRYRLGT